MQSRRFGPPPPQAAAFGMGDALVLLGVASLLYAGTRLALGAPAAIAGPEISLSPAALPWYALLSTGRMTAAYLLALLFSLAYGQAAARRRLAGRVLLPALDVLQSVPILSFLPVVLLSLSVLLPQGLAAELAAIILIFTSQAWNMTYSYWQSLTTQPVELREAVEVFRLDPWARLKTLDLPSAALGLVWNSMMSWAGGWFFLMAAEIFTVGARDFRLPGIGAYLQTAAGAGDLRAVMLGVCALVLTIVLLDQLVWRPLLAWSDRFRVDMTAGEETPGSWFLELLARAWIIDRATALLGSLTGRFDAWMRQRWEHRLRSVSRPIAPEATLWRAVAPWIVPAAILTYGGARAGAVLMRLPAGAWTQIGAGLLATLARVAASLAIALVWTVPAGVAIGMNRRLASFLQPVVQVVASVPATALFPVFLLLLLRAPGGLNIAAVALMLMGTQWYLLFNVIAGASAIPQDLRHTADLLGLSWWQRWRTLTLPAIFPYLVTGAITASGGAWNASIVAEHVEFGGHAHATVGVGALISTATGAGDYPLLLAATLALVLTVVTINRTFWRWLYRLSEERFRME